MLIGKSNHLSLIGNGTNPINYTFLKSSILNFFLKNLKYYKNNPKMHDPKIIHFFPKKHKKLTLSAQFNKLSTPNKLNYLGFTFTNINFLKTQTITNTNITLLTKTPINVFKILNIVNKQLVTLRSLHVYLTLYLSKIKQV